MSGNDDKHLRRRLSLSEAWLRLIWLVAALTLQPAWGQTTAPPAALAQPPSSLRLRIAWGGGARASWVGRIRLSSGVMSELVSLGMEADTPGMLRISQNSIAVKSPTPRGYQAVDLSIEAPPDATLMVELSRAELPHDLKTFTIPLSQLSERPFSEAIDAQDNRLLIRRAPGDQLRVDLHRDNLILSPGEPWKIDVTPNGFPFDSDRLELRAQIYEARSDNLAWSNSVSIAVDSLQRPQLVRDLAIPTPIQEGVYDLVLGVTSPNRRTLRGATKIYERRVQFVVLDDSAPLDRVASETQRTVLELNPADSRWWSSLRSLSPLTGSLRRFRMQSGDMVPAAAGDVTVGELPAGGSQSFTLPIDNAREPYRLFLTHPVRRQRLRITITEQDGNNDTAILDTVLFSDSSSFSSEDFAEYEVVFWPRNRSVKLILRNADRDETAQFATLRLVAGETAADPHADFIQRAVSAAPSTGAARKALATIESPFLTAEFNASRGVDETSGQRLTDWITFLEAANGLIEHVRAGGYSGAMINVYGHGTALFPSKLLDATPHADNGAYFNEGHDPLRKDVVELLLRMFAREGLQLVPTFRFTSPLPELERLAADTKSLPDLLSAEGFAWRQHRSPHGPYYDATLEEVQQALINVCREFNTRYRSHASLGGMAIELEPDSFACLPNVDWGYGPVTIDRYLAQRPSESGPIDTPEVLTQEFIDRLRRGDLADSWQSYRIDRITDLFQGIADTMPTRGAEPLPLFVLVNKLARTKPLVDALKPALTPRLEIEQALGEMGISGARLNAIPGITVCRPVDRGVAEGSYRTDRPEISQPGPIDRALQTEIHRSIVIRDAETGLSADELNPDVLRTVQRSHPNGDPRPREPGFQFAGDARRKELARALALFDAAVLTDAGDRPLFAEGSELREFTSVFTALPAAAFETIESPPMGSRSLVARTYVDDRYRYVYAVNDAPWSVDVVLKFRGNTSEFRPVLNGLAAGQWNVDSTGAEWRFRLPPYSLNAATLSAESEVISAEGLPPVDVVQKLKSRIAELIARASYFKQPLPTAWLRDPGFEQPNVTETGAWMGSPESPRSVVSDDRVARNGRRSIRLSRQGDNYVWMRSAILPTPTSGRLAVQTWVRFDPRYATSRLRVGVEGTYRDRPYYRFATIQANPENKSEAWVPFTLRIDDLPTEQLGDLRIRFDMLTTGVVWIDDVSLFDRSFTKEEQQELAKIISLADLQLRDGRIRECFLTLSGYWPRYVEQVAGDSIVRVATGAQGDIPK